MSTYDKWWSTGRQGVEPGSKRTRKPNSRFSDNDDGTCLGASTSSSSSNTSSKNKRKPHKGEVEMEDNNESPTKQPRNSSTMANAAVPPSPINTDTPHGTTETTSTSLSDTVMADAATAPSPPSNPPNVSATADAAPTTATEIAATAPSPSSNLPNVSATADASPTTATEITATAPSPSSNLPNVSATADASPTTTTVIAAPPPALPPSAGLKTFDDTSEGDYFRMWGEVEHEEFANKDIDGEFIECRLCILVIGTRRPFDRHRWKDHCGSKCHRDRVANHMGMLRSKDPAAKRKQKPMHNYFAVIPKKTAEIESAEVASAASSSTKPDVIVLDDDDDTNRKSSCAGIYNCLHGDKKRHIPLYLKYVAISERQRWCGGSYGVFPSIVSKDCTGEGIMSGKDGGMVCAACFDLWKARGNSNPGQTLNKWKKTLSRQLEMRKRETITASDRADAEAFIKTSDDTLNESGKRLKEEAVAIVDFANYMATIPLPSSTFKYVSENSVPGLDKFLVDIAKVYKEQPKFQDSLIVALMKVATAKMIHGPNAATSDKVRGFYRLMGSYNKKVTQFVSANLFGPGWRHIQRMNAKDREQCIVTDIIKERAINAIRRRSPQNSDGNSKNVVPFSIAIDATKVVANLEHATDFGAIIGGEFPNHFISTTGMSGDQVQEILDGNSNKYGKIPEALEEKAALMIFQDGPPGVPKFEIIAFRPQSNNEANEFVTSVEDSVSAAMVATNTHASSFINFAVDGVSCESKHVQFRICCFLSGKCNFTGTTDPNHNAKSWRYQVIGGGDLVGCTIGRYVLDVGLLRLGLVSFDLIRPVDFASDRLVTELYSHTSLCKISNARPEFGPTREGDKAVLTLTLFFLRLHLHAVNDLDVPSMHRAQYLWCSMLWLTSISGASMITKRNIVSETISFMFMVMRADVSKPRHLTSEPLEHFFGMLRQMIREFTVLESVQLCERLGRRLRLLYENKFSPSRDPSKGYTATFKDFFQYGLDRNDGSTADEGSVHLQTDGGEDVVAVQLWESVSNMISFSSELMKKLLDAVGVTSADLSPFCRRFHSLVDLRNEYIRYMPRTFVYDGIRGASSVVEDEQVGGGDDSGDNDHGSDDSSSRMAGDRIERLAAALTGDDGGEQSDDEDVEVVEIDGSPPSSTSSDTTEIVSLSSDVNKPDELMTSFRTMINSFSSSSNIGESLDDILHSSACLANSEHVSGSISSARKTKSLVDRWVARPVARSGDMPSPSTEDILIERDVIILVNVKIGSGSGAATVQRHFRVLEIFEKYYNKWFVSKESTKKFRNEAKSYKVLARMLEVNEYVHEYSDVEMYDDTFNKKDIVKNVEDKMILSVVGKLVRV